MRAITAGKWASVLPTILPASLPLLQLAVYRGGRGSWREALKLWFVQMYVHRGNVANTQYTRESRESLLVNFNTLCALCIVLEYVLLCCEWYKHKHTSNTAPPHPPPHVLFHQVHLPGCVPALWPRPAPQRRRPGRRRGGTVIGPEGAPTDVFMAGGAAGGGGRFWGTPSCEHNRPHHHW